MRNRGFTLIEMLIVIGLFTVVASIGLFVSMDTYNNSSFHNERDLFISTLLRARAQAINNVCISTPTLLCNDGKGHGVHIEVLGGAISQFTIFQGPVYDSTDIVNEVLRTNHFIKTNNIQDVYFEQLSGNVTTPVVITLSDNANESSVINIGSEGQVYWTN